MELSLESTADYVDSVEKYVNKLNPYTRRADIYPFDTVAGEVLAKSISLARCAILLIEQGYSDEAYGLCRSLYECYISLRYMTENLGRRDERASSF